MQAVSLTPLAKTSSLKQLEKQMDSVRTYNQWIGLARDHDRISGAQKWRETLKSSSYSFAEIDSRNKHLKECLNSGSYRETLYALNEGVHGNMGGMGRPRLYQQAKAGTKLLIDEYVSTIAKSLEFIHSAPESEIPLPEKLDFFRRASHCYGRSALLLSGGAGLIYFHHGVAQELINQNLLPNVISGASAGSIMAAQLGSLTDEELSANYFSEKRYHEAKYEYMVDALLGRSDPLDDKQAWERVLDEFIPDDLTFQEAFERTGRYINISISPAEKHQSSRLMNAITSPNVYIRSAVHASCSVPGMFPPIRLWAKGSDGKPRPYLANRRWVDGSVSGDLPAKRLMRLYGVNHFIVSLINPFVVPFIEDTKIRKSKGLSTTLSESFIRVLTESLTISERFLDNKGNTGSRLAAQLAYLVRMMEQTYLGDINILLRKENFIWRHTLYGFKPGEIENLIDLGMRSTWPKIAQIKNAALISKTLDRILEEVNQEALPEKQSAKHHIYT